MTKCNFCKKDIVLYLETQDSFIQINHRFYHLECAIKVKQNQKLDDYSEDIPNHPSKPKWKSRNSASFWGKVKEKCSSCGRPKDHHTRLEVRECIR